jgi:PAS domain S-box-containing protein
MAANHSRSEHQKEAESKIEGFQQHLGPFVVAAETTRMPMIFTDAKDPDRPIIFANDAFLGLTGYCRDEVLGQSVKMLMLQGADSNVVAEIDRAFDGDSQVDPQIRFCRRDGTIFWASVFVCSVKDYAGAVVQHFASFLDLTQHRLEQDRLRFLLSELNHRTQNTLATVISIIGQTLNGMADMDVIDTLEGRVLALSRTHSLLGAENWEQIGIREILHHVLSPFGADDAASSRFSIEGDNARLMPKAALTLAMVFHELATNAVRHGAFSEGSSGKVAVSCHVEAASRGRWLKLTWKESGGPKVLQPSHKGFGFRLIDRGLAQEVNGDVSLVFNEAGVVCRIDLPISQAADWMKND